MFQVRPVQTIKPSYVRGACREAEYCGPSLSGLLFFGAVAEPRLNRLFDLCLQWSNLLFEPSNRFDP